MPSLTSLDDKSAGSIYIPTNRESASRSVVSDSLWPHGLYSPWNSLGQNTGAGSLSLLQGIFLTRDWTQVSCIAGGFFTSWATREAQEYWSAQPTPSPGALPTPGIKLGSAALQVDSLPTELLGKPTAQERSLFATPCPVESRKMVQINLVAGQK